MLKGINPLLTGDLLQALDRLGHSDEVVISDAHFPAYRLGAHARVLDIPASVSDLAAAIHSVLQLDDTDAITLMSSGDGWNEVQHAIVDALGVPAYEVRTVDRSTFYARAGAAQLIVRSADTRPFGNVIVRKGVTASFNG